jgi:hypothetical protein
MDEKLGFAASNEAALPEEILKSPSSPKFEEARQQRKSLGRRVSFAATAHVRHQRLIEDFLKRMSAIHLKQPHPYRIPSRKRSKGTLHFQRAKRDADDL